MTFALRTPEAPAAPNGFTDVQRELTELRAANQKLQQRLEALASAAPVAASPASAERSAAPTVSQEQIAAAVAAYLKNAAGPELADAAAVAAVPKFDLDADFAALKVNYWEDPSGWKRAHAAGKMDEVIKKFEALAKASPNDTKVQMELANAYMAYLQLDQTKWQLSMKADGVYDRVLDLDDKHWEARFTKAVSYTFWPDFLGKKKDAITHFETLVAQQETMPPQEHEAETYLYLGNLLEARDAAKAKEVWAKGARRHPANQELAKKSK
ncbi:MAG: hypothetical protein WBO45_10960 [Planctomycetota bacterium]